MELVFLWLILGFASAIVASSKGRSAFGWLIAGFFFGPVALFMVGVMRRFLAEVKRQNEAEVTIDADELAELKRKSRNFEILMGASKREIAVMWDAMTGTGCPSQPLIDALERRQR